MMTIIKESLHTGMLQYLMDAIVQHNVGVEGTWIFDRMQCFEWHEGHSWLAWPMSYPSSDVLGCSLARRTFTSSFSPSIIWRMRKEEITSNLVPARHPNLVLGLDGLGKWYSPIHHASTCRPVIWQMGKELQVPVCGSLWWLIINDCIHAMRDDNIIGGIC